MFGPCYVMQPPKMRRNQCRRGYFKTVLHLALTWLLLMTATVLKKAAIVDGALQRTTCARFVGQYRDCTCSVMYRDVEERCCNRYTCFQPRMRSENFTCPMVCQNGGTRINGPRPCLCRSGYHGLCCERGILSSSLYIYSKFMGGGYYWCGWTLTRMQFYHHSNPKMNARWRLVAHISVGEH